MGLENNLSGTIRVLSTTPRVARHGATGVATTMDNFAKGPAL